jgi:hypothetical protein
MDETCYIYLIAHQTETGIVGPVKIGISKTLSGRLSQLQTGNPRKVVVAMYLPLPNREMAAIFESAFHEVMAKHRMEGEWFDMSPYSALIALTQNVRSGLQHFLGDDEELLEEALAACRLLEAEELVRTIAALDQRNRETLQ